MAVENISDYQKDAQARLQESKSLISAPPELISLTALAQHLAMPSDWVNEQLKELQATGKMYLDKRNNLQLHFSRDVIIQLQEIKKAMKQAKMNQDWIAWDAIQNYDDIEREEDEVGRTLAAFQFFKKKPFTLEELVNRGFRLNEVVVWKTYNLVELVDRSTYVFTDRINILGKRVLEAEQLAHRLKFDPGFLT